MSDKIVKEPGSPFAMAKPSMSLESLDLVLLLCVGYAA